MRIALQIIPMLVVGMAGAAVGQTFYGGYPYYSRASTPAESYMRGFADVVRSAGENNLRNSQAARNYEQARSQYLDNRLKATQTYFEMRRINKSYRDSQRRPQLTSEQLRRIAAEKAPDRMDPTQLDPVTGKINWPILLRDDRFRESREQLDRLFARRAERSGVIGHETYETIQETVDRALAELKEMVTEVNTTDYIAAKNFLNRLAHEARYPIS